MFDSSFIRESFLKFFEKSGHVRFPSSSLIPYDDPTLLFTNAGMNQFKKIFLGEVKSDLKRAISAQKCIRVSGKHNDLEEVGKDGRHHTFFEMLGNWSFGDYYKKEAIIWAWEYLTKELNLPKDRLYVSVYKDDDESYNIWKDTIGIDPKKVYRLGDIEKGDEENFWSMGDTGPCGPCTEIYYDQGEKVGCGKPDCTLTCSCDRYLELWNLVFMEFNRDESGKLTPLPFKSVDTGMGLERITSIVQGVTSSYETDLFKPLIKELESISKKSFLDKEYKVPFQIILDHIRAISFAIADGVIPSNEGRGYVIRRILRRASRQSRKLGIKEEFLYRLVDPLIEKMGDPYPELKENRDKLIHIIKDEEKRFNKTLDNGLIIYEKFKKELRDNNKNILDGEKVFILHDTYGFPLDLTRQIALEDNLKIDEDGFYRIMEVQKEKSRTVKENLDLSKVMEGDWIVFEKTESKNLCYEKYYLKTKINGILFDFEGEENFDIFFKETPFYPLSGGQVNDIGLILIKKEQILENEMNFLINKMFNIDILEIDDEKRKDIIYSIGEEYSYNFGKNGEYIILFVSDVFKTNYGPMHRGNIINTNILIDEINKNLKNFHNYEIFLIVDRNRRYNIMRNHTVTHLLHQTLYNVLGNHVKQAGSYVGPDILRFDFTHFEKIDQSKIELIQNEINSLISKDLKVTIYENIELEMAKKMGAKALFEEKYSDKVRVVKVDDYSIELCGGTHSPHTSFIQNFKILKEESISSGIRRIEAITGPAFYKYYKEKGELVENILTLLNQKDENNLIKRLKLLIDENKELKKELQKYSKDKIKQSFEFIKNSYKTLQLNNKDKINRIKIYSGLFEEADIKVIRDFIDGIRTSDKEAIILVGNINEDNCEVIVSSSKEVSEVYNCSDILKKLSVYFNIRGGGRKDFATGGSMDIEKIKEFFTDNIKKDEILKDIFS